MRELLTDLAEEGHPVEGLSGSAQAPQGALIDCEYAQEVAEAPFVCENLSEPDHD
jgi:hypothetical protein